MKENTKELSTRTSKGIAIHTAVVIIMFALFLFVGTIVIYKWINPMRVRADRASCVFKLIAYCVDWKINDFADDKRPWIWEAKNPKGCEEFGIPPSGSSEPMDEDCAIISD